MNSLLFHEPAWRLLGWAMLHFLWIGAGVALAGAMLRLACRRATAGVRYAASLAALTALVAAAASVGVWAAYHAPATVLSEKPVADAAPVAAAAPGAFELKGSAYDVAPSAALRGVGDDAPPELAAAPTPSGEPALVGTPAPVAEGVLADAANSNGAPVAILDEIAAGLDAVAPYLPWLWLAGAAATFLWLATGLTGARRLRRTCRPIVDGPIAALGRELQTALGVTRRVTIALSDHVVQPVLVGIVRPLVLLPAAAASGWQLEQLELALAHELAHVRRWDNAVNLLQRVIEAVLWFHPAVWLLSRQVRRDREACCDAAVVRLTGRAEAYADLLVQIAASLSRRQPAALAAASALGSHPLATRVRRILNIEDEAMKVSRSTIGIVAAALIAAIALALPLPGAMQSADANQDDGATLADKDNASEDNADDHLLAPADGDETSQLTEVIDDLRQRIAAEEAKLQQLITDEDAAWDNAVAAALQRDPMIANYEQQIAEINAMLKQRQAIDPPQDSPQLHRMRQSRAEVDEMMQQYRARAERELREQLTSGNEPNDALQQQLLGYRARRELLQAELKQLRAELAKLEPEPAGDDAADVENSGEPKPLHDRVYSKSEVNVPLMRVFLRVVSPAPGEQGAGGDPRFPEKMTYAETADGFRISAPELVHESIDRWFTREGIPADEADGPADANLIVANGVTIMLSGTSRDELEKLLWRTAEWNPQDRAEYDLTTVDHVTGVDNAAADILKDIQNPYGPLPEAYLRWTVPGERAVVLAPRAAHAMLHILFDEDSPVLQRERNKRAIVDPELHDALTPPATLPPAASEDAAAPSDVASSIAGVVRKMVNNAADVDEQLAVEDLRGFVVEFAAEADSKLVDRYVEVLESRGRPFKLHNDGDHVWIEAPAVAYPVEPPSGPATKELVLQQPADMSQADLKALAGDIRAQGYDCRVAMRRLHDDGSRVEGSSTPLLIVTVPADFNGRPVYETRMEGGRMRRTVRLVGTGVPAPPGGIGEPYAAPLRSPTAPASQTPTTPTTGEDAVDRYLAPDTGPIHLNVTKNSLGSVDELEILASRRYIINFAGDVPLEVVNAYVKRFEQSGDRQVFLHRAGNGYVLAVNAVRAKENNPEPPPQESATASGPFLTDRQQRVADAAYQILGWELEPLDGDERAAVKQAGYDGGLRVVGFRDNRGGALGGVILVGLHTSPIADFDDLGEFLARTDLPERSPVKYYWLARNSGGGAGGFAGPGGVGAGRTADSPPYQLVKNRVAIQHDAWAAYRQSLEPPRVLQTTPAIAQANVTATLAAIEITFSKPMTGTWVAAAGDGEFPEMTGGHGFSPDGRTYTLPVKLKPGTKYALRFNAGQSGGFQDRDGRRLEPFTLTFTTASDADVARAAERPQRGAPNEDRYGDPQPAPAPAAAQTWQTTAYLMVEFQGADDKPLSAKQLEQCRLTAVAAVKDAIPRALAVGTSEGPDSPVEQSTRRLADQLNEKLKVSFPNDGNVLELRLDRVTDVMDTDHFLLNRVVKQCEEAIADKFANSNAGFNKVHVLQLAAHLDQGGNLVYRYQPATASPPTDSAGARYSDPAANPDSPSPFPPGGGGQSGGRYSAPQSIATAQPAKLKPFDTVIIRVANGLPDAPIDDAFALDERGRVALGPVFGRVAIGGMTIEQAEEAVTKHLKKFLREPMVQITRPVEPVRGAAAPAPQQQLLYDGQTFEQWRAKWQYELKTDRRIEAIDALAAFARAGKRREAAEAILDIAAEYDFSQLEGSPDAQLKLRVVDVLTETGGPRVPTDAWFPLLIERCEANPAKWKWLASQLVRNLRAESEDIQAQLWQWARDPAAALNQAALTALARNPSTETALHDLALEMLAGEPAKAQAIVDWLGGPDNVNQLQAIDANFANTDERLDELLVAMTRADLAARRQARPIARTAAPQQRAQLAVRLATMLNGEASATDLLPAIRGFGDLPLSIGGPRQELFESALARLDQIARSDADLDAAIAATCAVVRWRQVLGERTPQKTIEEYRVQIAENFPDLTPEEFKTRLKQEVAEVRGMPRPPKENR